MKYVRALPLIIPLLVWCLGQVYFFYPRLIYVVAVLIILLNSLIPWRFARQAEEKRKWWQYIILPALFSLSIITYSTLFTSKWFVQSLFLVNLVFLYFYFVYLYHYLLRPISYRPFSLENISFYGSFLIIFFLSSSLYGLQSLLSMSIWIAMIILLVVTFLIVYQLFWFLGFKFKEKAIMILVSSLVLVELGWSLSFLPFNHNVAGAILAIVYYIMTGLTKAYIGKRLKGRDIKLYLAFGLGNIIIILLTARWL